MRPERSSTISDFFVEGLERHSHRRQDRNAARQPTAHSIMLFLQWAFVLIDVQLLNRNSNPASGGRRTKGIRLPRDGSVWPLLLEKAWCVHAGGWDHITGGKSCLAFKCMTGCDEVYGIRNVTRKDPDTPPEYRCLEYNWPAFTNNEFFCEKEEWGERCCDFPTGQNRIGVDELFDMLVSPC